MTSTGIREISYRFGDASVPPEDHRSFDIRVMPQSVNVTVTSYGEVLALESFPFDEGRFREVISALGRCGIRSGDFGEDDGGCTGGTTETIEWVDGSGAPFSASVYHCGGQDFGTLAGDAAGFLSELRRLAPALDTII